MSSMTIAIAAFIISLFSSVVTGYLSRKDPNNKNLFSCFAVTTFCLGSNSAILIFKLLIGV